MVHRPDQAHRGTETGSQMWGFHDVCSPMLQQEETVMTGIFYVPQHREVVMATTAGS